MSASSISQDAIQDGRGATLAVVSIGRAPGPAVHAPQVAAMMSGQVRLIRATRPPDEVSIQAGADYVLAVRVNHLARTAAGAPPDVARLKQCLAPDFHLMLSPAGSVVLPAHAAQDVLAIAIHPDAVARLTGKDPGSLKRRQGRIVSDRLVSEMVERLFETAVDLPLAESLLRSLLLSLDRAATSDAASRRRVGGLTARQLARLRDHVETRLADPLHIADLAGLVELSPFHFARAFKRSMGASPGTWIRLRRLTLAQKLLADPGRSVGEVAAAVGYDSPSRFAQAFRSLTGQTPAAFRDERA
ncbi:MAG: helix-turn-helix transcriptional regulator [Brevundimonas sp.]|uniref:helix-turn-helix transcriptional regulator n=1 Tax=Brevundimonas sp. TaxID=1871086 RepID=UPI00274B29F2|nr:helix-turn-helix transcriptional regulator [Brevundimonas sp.]MDP3400413.1 helix-turn-helix transcriptional regulator [Brevundimonas sp.]MDZ4111206.1 helix-turn-helix transcriptional regulator [Brevundimonas sp.]